MLRMTALVSLVCLVSCTSAPQTEDEPAPSEQPAAAPKTETEPLEHPAAAVDVPQTDSTNEDGGVCVVGLELSPGQSCTDSAGSTLTVLEGGCLSVSGTLSIGRMCGAAFTFNGLRLTPVNDVNFRLELP